MLKLVLFQNFFQKQSSILQNVTRNTSKLPRKKPKVGTIKHRNLIKSTEGKLAARGFLRSQKPYNPPENTRELLLTVINKRFPQPAEPFKNSEEKYHLLNECWKIFNHSVPNSMLHHISRPQDLFEFYLTPVSTTTPLDEFRLKKDLPPNLHIQYDYVRFNPETDTMFNGLTAFPESSTLVTGVKEKRKYTGAKQKLPNYYDNWSDYIKW